MEFKEGLDLLLSKCELNSEIIRADEVYSPALDSVLDSANFNSNTPDDLHPLYVFSLSDIDDQLSQWRAYGMYSIEIDPGFLKGTGISIEKCLYSEKDKEEQMTTLVRETLDSYKHNLNMPQKGLANLAMYQVISEEMIKRLGIFKNSGFSEECETRLLMYKKHFNLFSGIDYRCSGNSLIPYWEIDIPPESIKGITVGPVKNQDLAYKSLRHYMYSLEHEDASLDYGWINKDSSRNLRKSEVSYVG
jgi:hypothetical protein